jgi:hypothetical protein
VALAVTILVAACGSDEPASTADGTGATTEPVETTLGGGGNAPASVEVDRTAWYGGFRVTVDGVAFEPPPGGGAPVVHVDLTLANEGETSVAFIAELTLAIGELALPASDWDMPSVPGGASGEAWVAFEPAGEVDLREAALVIGRASTTQARIPFVGDEGAVTLEPVTAELGDELEVGDLTVLVESVEVRADDPGYHSQADAGSAWLIVHWAATDSSDSGTTVGETTLRLATPDGLRIAPEDYASAFITAGSSEPDLTTTFPFDPAAGGEHVLVVTSTDGDGVEHTGELPLEIPAFDLGADEGG